MSVERVLDKITKHNSDVLGCIAMAGDGVFHNLPEKYDLVDYQDVSEYAQNMFELTDGLETGRAPFDQFFLEFPEYSVFAKKMDEGVLVLLNRPIERGAFKKMQVGVNLFMKPLKRALADPQPEPDPEPVVEEPAEAEKPKSGRIYRGIRY